MGQSFNHLIGSTLRRSVFDPRDVIDFVHPAEADVLACRQIKLRKILKNYPNELLVFPGVERFYVDAVQKNFPAVGIIETAQELDECSFPGAVVSNESDTLIGLDMKIKILQNVSFGPGISERNVFECDPFLDMEDGSFGKQRCDDLWLQIEKSEKVVDKKIVFIERDKVCDDPAEPCLGLGEGAGIERQITKGDGSIDSAVDDINVNSDKIRGGNKR